MARQTLGRGISALMGEEVPVAAEASSSLAASSRHRASVPANSVPAQISLSASRMLTTRNPPSLVTSSPREMPASCQLEPQVLMALA